MKCKILDDEPICIISNVGRYSIGHFSVLNIGRYSEDTKVKKRIITFGSDTLLGSPAADFYLRKLKIR